MRDHRLVHAAVFLIFVALSLVYALFVHQKEDAVRDDILVIMKGRWIIPWSEQWELYAEESGNLSWTHLQASGDHQLLEGGALSGSHSDQKTDDLALTGEDSFLTEILQTTTGNFLSGTNLYYGSLDVLKKIGVRYEYILKDTTYDIYYAYIGKNVSYSISSLTQAIWWKTIEIYAKNDIINNLYFWERVTFVELPDQLPTRITLFVRVGNKLWMIQDDTGEYKKHKRHIRRLFTNQ